MNEFVHVERDHVLERQLSRLVQVHEFLVGSDRRRSGGQPENERVIRRGFEIDNRLGNVMSDPFAEFFIIFLNDETHENFILSLC